MKKVFITMIAALLAFNLHASQGSMVISGSIGLDIEGEVSINEVVLDARETTFFIAPSFTYFVGDRFGIGAELMFMTESVNIDNVDAVNTFGFGVFGRYYVLQTQRWGIFGQAGLGFAFNEDATGIHFGITPGVQFFINDRWSVETRMGNLLSLTTVIPDGNMDAVTDFNFLVNPFQVGFAPLSLALNFHF